MYQVDDINERLFHWQSQSTTSAESPTGQVIALAKSTTR